MNCAAGSKAHRKSRRFAYCGALQKGQGCQAQVTFVPTSKGKRTGVLEVNSGKAGMQKVKLSGKGK